MHPLSPSLDDPDVILDNFVFILGSERKPDVMIEESLFEVMVQRSESIIAEHESGEVPLSPETLQKARFVLKLAAQRLADCGQERT